MKPKKVICPICGKEMTPNSWGKKRGVAKYCGARIPCDMINYIDYTCPCGCAINYEGDLDCWQECKCKCSQATKCFRCGKEFELGEIRYEVKNYVICLFCKSRGLDD